MNSTMVPKKLTKKFFADLSEGVFLVSNCCSSPIKPLFAEFVTPSAQRGDQWIRIKEAKADQRHCIIFKSEEEYKEFVESWKQSPNGCWERQLKNTGGSQHPQQPSDRPSN